MAHPHVDNRTPWMCELLHVADEEGRPVVAVIVKGTFDVSASGLVTEAVEQQPVMFAGAFHGDPEHSSYRFEPDFAFVKPATDVSLVGHAHATRAKQVETLVKFSVGELSREILVTGERTWQSRWIGARASDPLPFERIPLVWERAFGGWDRSAEDPAKHSFEPRNPVGVGYRARGAELVEGSPLPNIEDPDDRLTRYTGRVVPAGLGVVGASWKPRARLAGTYDEAWSQSRKPRLPVDFDRRFFNCAAPGLTAAGYLRGDETVSVVNASPAPLKFRLPGRPNPRVRLVLRNAEDVLLDTQLDTVVVDADRMRVILTWRTHATLRDGPLDVRSALVASPESPAFGRAAPLTR